MSVIKDGDVLKASRWGLDSDGEVATVPDDESLNFGDESFSIFVRATPREGASYDDLIRKTGDSDRYYIYPQVHEDPQDKVCFRCLVDDGTSSHYDDTDEIYQAGEPHNVAFVIDREEDEARVYVNGELDVDFDLSTTGTVNPDADLYIGEHCLTETARLIDRAITEDEVQQLEEDPYKELGGEKGFWKLNEGQGKMVYDYSSNGNHGTKHEDMVWVRLGSNIMRQTFAKYLIDTDYTGYINVDRTDDLMFDEEFTLMAWIKPKVLEDGTHHGMFAFASWNEEISLYLSDPDRFRFHLQTEGESGYTGGNFGPNLEVDTWYFVTAVYDGEEMRGYIDGEEQRSWSQSGSVQNYPEEDVISIIGGRNSPERHEAKSDYAVHRAFNRALSDEEIQFLYENPYEILGDEVGLWMLIEGAGKFVRDLSGYGHHGRIVDAEWKEGDVKDESE